MYFKFIFFHFVSHHANQSFRICFIVHPGFYHIRCGSNGVKEGNKKDTEKLRKSNTVCILIRYSPPVSYNSYSRFHSIVILLNWHLRLSVSSFPFFCLVLLSFITEYEFDEASRDFHATVDHATAMVGYENARVIPALDGNDYDTAFSILEALVSLFGIYYSYLPS